MVKTKWSTEGVNEVRMNHEGCPAGEDTKKRLYLKVTDDNKLMLAHCFHCGGGGAIKFSSGGPRRRSAIVTPNVDYDLAEAVFNHIDDVYRNATSMLTILDWPMQYFTECAKEFAGDKNCYGLRKDSQYYYLPRGEAPNVTGYDLRSYPVKGFKRILHPAHAKGSNLLIFNSTGSKTAVIVEDPISAMKVDLAGYAGVSLCTNNLSDTDAFKLSVLYDKLLVWLDNDSDLIIKNAQSAAMKLQLYKDNVGFEAVHADPKSYHLNYISEIIERDL
jgi:hypothetical protein